MTKNFSEAPYFDDFEENKNFFKIMFKPGKPVQTRELNQLQTILQNQIAKMGDHFFKNGSMVIPGHIFYDNKIVSLKVEELNNNNVSADIILPNLVGKIITNASGVKARVMHYEYTTSDAESYPLLFVKYISGSNSTDSIKFVDGETISAVDDAGLSVILTGSSESAASIVTIQEGIYYVNDFFVKTQKQTIVLEKYSKTPTYRIGLKVVENIITSEEDETLYDNALGYSNYAAPGADRYNIELILEKRSFNYDDAETDTEEKFIDLLHVKNGNVILKVKDTEYAELEKMFAKRTYDESGNYEVNPFNIEVKELRNNRRGNWTANTVYLLGDIVLSDGGYWESRSEGISGSVAPTIDDFSHNDGSIEWVRVHSPEFNDGLYLFSNLDLESQKSKQEKIGYVISEGKAYIKGFDVETETKTIEPSDKALTSSWEDQEVIPFNLGSWAQLTNIVGLPNIDECEKVDIYPHRVGEFSGVTATAIYTVTAGVITAVTITNKGSGYTKHNPPTITVSGGTGAVLRATIDAAGQVESIKIVSGGTGYTDGSATISAPTSKPIGSCRIRSFEYAEGIIGDTDAKYNLQIFDLDVVNGYDITIHGKSFSGATFSGNLVTRKITVNGTHSAVGADKEITGLNTSYLSELVVGQTIDIEGSEEIVANITSNISFTTLTTFAQTGKSDIFAVYSAFVNGYPLMLTMPKKNIKTIKNSLGENNTEYTVKRRFKDVTVVGNSLTLNLTKDGELFEENTSGNYIVSNQSDGSILTYTTITPSGQTLTISGLSLASGTAEVIATVTKQGAAAVEKTKTLAIKEVTVRNVKQLASTEISLTEADIYRLIKVYKVKGQGTAVSGEYPVIGSQPLEDITDDFIMNNGQTSYSYNIGKIIRKNGKVAPNNTIKIVFEYFQHSAGDYFSIDSYVNISSEKLNSKIKDYIDFRPRVSDNGTEFVTSTGASITEPLQLESYFICDYGYYLPRVDVLSMNKDGAVDVKNGKPDLNAREPLFNLNNMKLASIYIEPGLNKVSTNTYKISRANNKRYTMADLTNLEKRVDTLEYYSQLSLLESKAITEDVLDQNGLSRFKSGIQVDGFINQDVCDYTNDDFSASINIRKREASALERTAHIKLEELNESDNQRKANHYQLTGSSVTLPYSEVLHVSQPISSRSEEINPFATANYNPNVILYPNADSWVETQFNQVLPPAPPSPTSQKTDNSSRTTYIAALKSGKIDTYSEWHRKTYKEGALQLYQNDSGATFLHICTGNSYDTINFQYNEDYDDVMSGKCEKQQYAAYVKDKLRKINKDTKSTVSNQAISSNNTVPIDTSDKLVSEALVPYARTRPVFFILEKARPDTKYSAKFGNIDVLNNIEMATVISYDENNALIPSGINAYKANNVTEDSIEHTARIVDNKKIKQYTDSSLVEDFFWDRGQVVVQYVSGSSGAISASGVIGNTAVNEAKTIRNIKLINVKGTFTSDKNVYIVKNNTNSLLIATTAINSISTLEKVKTDNVGRCAGVLYIPCKSDMKIPSGEINLNFYFEGSSTVPSSYASTKFISNGFKEVVARVSSSPIPSTIETLNTDATISSVTTFNTEDTASNPIAQTFMLDESDSIVERNSEQKTKGQGAFVTSIGLFFEEKDTELPLLIQLRSVVNGYPTKKVIASEILYPSDISVSANASVETKVKFTDPVFLENNTEYAITILSDSINYKLWFARMGEKSVENNKTIEKQPSLGVLFKSQNGSTWTPEQLEDLKFKIYRAKFDITKSGTVRFVNNNVSRIRLEPGSLYAVAGSTDIRVFQNNNGFKVGDLVWLREIDSNGVSQVLSAQGPFPTGFNAGPYTVSAADYNSYVLSSVGAAVATYSGYFGEGDISVNRNIIFSKIIPRLNYSIFNGTDVAIHFITMNTTYQYDLDEEEIVSNESRQFNNERMIASYINENAFMTVIDGIKKSMRLRFDMTSTDDFYSPILNIDDVSTILIRNEINLPSVDDNTVIDKVEIADNVTVDYDYNSTNIDESYILVSGTDFTTYEGDIDNLSIGKFLSIETPSSGTASVNVGNKFLITGLQKSDSSYKIFVRGTGMTDESSSIAKTSKLVLLNRYIDAISPYESSVLGTYIAKEMGLELQAGGLLVTIDINKPSGTDIEVYYRTGLKSDYTALSKSRWFKLEPKIAISNTKDEKTFIEVQFEKENMNLFDVAQVKVVFKSNSSARTPKIKNFRVMALV